MSGKDPRHGAARLGRRHVVASGLLLALALGSAPPVRAEHCTDLAGHLVSVEGEVRVGGSAARMDDEICAGVRIEVGRFSRAAVRLDDTQTIVRIDRGAVLEIRPSNTGRSWLELLRGVLYVFSRRPEALRVDTPYINAAIDGTEFVVEATAGRGAVTVIEGRVRVANAAGELRLGPSEAAIATADAAPARRSVVDPQDAVRWALHYPPIGAAERTGGDTRDAAELLATGDVETATRLLASVPEDAVSLALRSMIAVTQNRPDEAMRLAERAVETDPASAVARTALSYAHQARFDIEAALASARTAVTNDPRDAHALARQAELELGVDETGAALASAREAVRVDPDNSRARTVLGFVHLIRLEVGAARSAFAEAVARDPGDPLPRLGFGLATIRDGELAAGREHIEVAASLDPNDALIRSYLGKAYVEERQPEEAAAQLALAKSLDPEDPTPWFYDALLAQALNRPVDAFRNIERARALNDNRLVYQSRLLVDKDAAAGSLSLARIYTDLGFEQPAIVESTRSIETDPSNFSAYRFLADSYAGRERHEAARRSVLFQASLLQPLTIDPVQPYAQESDLLILPGTDPVDPSIREYSPLFEREGFQLAGSLVAGGDDTFGDNLVLSGLHDRVAYGLGQFHYETDGLRRNADVEHDVYHGFVQGQVRPGLFLQADLHHRESEQGDYARNFDATIPDSGSRVRKQTTSPGIGLRVELEPRSTLLAATRLIDRSVNESVPDTPPYVQLASAEFDGHSAFVKLIHRGGDVTHGVGVDAHELGLRRVDDIEPCPSEPCLVERGETEIRYASSYYYADVALGPRMHWTLGLSYTVFDDEQLMLDRRLANPKLGLRWRPTRSQELRFAASRGVKFRDVADLGFEPTVLAGFNQRYDDFGGTRHVDVGIAYDRQLGPATLAGAELVHRELDVPSLFRPDPEMPELVRSFDEPQRETLARGYWHRILGPELALGTELLYERLERDDSRDAGGFPFDFSPLLVETLAVPIGLSYTRASGFFVRGEISLVHQSIERIEVSFSESGIETDVVEDSEYFANVDLSAGVRFPGRRTTFRLDVGNLLDEDFLFEGSDIRSAEPSSPRFSPGRTVVARVSFSFR